MPQLRRAMTNHLNFFVKITKNPRPSSIDNDFGFLFYKNSEPGGCKANIAGKNPDDA